MHICNVLLKTLLYIYKGFSSFDVIYEHGNSERSNPATTAHRKT
jgi:hypothetical protein